MIKCNLAVILAERGLKISDVAAKTGISRTTLTALSYNQGKGVQFDTLEKICEFLDVTPGELFTHYLFTIKLTEYQVYEGNKNSEYAQLTFAFKDNGPQFEGTVGCDWKTEEGRFVIVIWNKLYNRLSKIPQTHMAQVFMENFELVTGLHVTATPEIALYDTETDDMMHNNEGLKKRTPN